MLNADVWRKTRPTLERYGPVVDTNTPLDGSIKAMADPAIAALTGPTIVVGFSIGAYVAQQIASMLSSQIGGDGAALPRLSRTAVAASFISIPILPN